MNAIAPLETPFPTVVVTMQAAAESAAEGAAAALSRLEEARPPICLLCAQKARLGTRTAVEDALLETTRARTGRGRAESIMVVMPTTKMYRRKKEKGVDEPRKRDRVGLLQDPIPGRRGYRFFSFEQISFSSLASPRGSDSPCQNQRNPEFPITIHLVVRGFIGVRVTRTNP